MSKLLNLLGTKPNQIPTNSDLGRLAFQDFVKVGTGLSIDGSGIISASSSSTKTISNQIAAYIVVSGDLGKIINCTSGTFTVSLTAAATLGSGFTCTIWNTSDTGADTITIDPATTETIDGKPTLILKPGEGLAIVCDGTNWQIDDKKPMRVYAENVISSAVRPVLTGIRSVAIGAGTTAYTDSLAVGNSATATGDTSCAIGQSSTASGVVSLALGAGSTASTTNSTAIGRNSGGTGSQAVTGAGAMALGGSYASGQDSFAAAIANNTSSYGATGFGAVAIGMLSKASGNYSIALGKGAISSGGLAITTDDGTGMYATSTQTYAVAIGGWAHANLIGQYSFASGGFGSTGDAQYSKMVLRAQTTTTTSVVLTSNAAAASATNQVVAKLGQCIAFKGTLIGHNYAGGLTNQAVVYDITGILLSNGNSGGVSLHDSSVLTRLGTDGIGITTDPTLSVNATYNALTITSGNKATTNIRWVATVHLTMVV
jgi:hypothetical protein